MSKFQDFSMPVRLSAQAQAAKMHADNPECAKLADEMRAIFGDDLIVTAISERGKVTARKSHKADHEFALVLSADDFLRLGRLSKQSQVFAEGSSRNARRK